MASILPVKVLPLHFKVAGQVDLKSWKDTILIPMIITGVSYHNTKKSRHHSVDALLPQRDMDLLNSLFNVGRNQLIPCKVIGHLLWCKISIVSGGGDRTEIDRLRIVACLPEGLTDQLQVTNRFLR
jgi:hypothetical protein